MIRTLLVAAGLAVAPEMSFLSGPTQPVNFAAPFHFAAVADPTLTGFECRIAGVHEWQTCSSPSSPDLPTGRYTFQVRAVDSSDNRSSAAAWTWTVDKVAPETSLVAGPSGTVTSRSATFVFASNEPGHFLCTLDGVGNRCGSPTSYSGLALGSHTFRVIARDTAGNEDQSPVVVTWTVADEPAVAGSGPSGATTVTPPVRRKPRLVASYAVVGARTTFLALAVRNAEAGATVTLSCKGRGCPLRRKRFSVSGHHANLLEPLKRKRLRAGTVIEIRVTDPAGHAKVFRYTMRRGNAPRRRTRCAVSSGKLRRCG